MWYTIFSFSITSAALLIALLGIWLTAILPLIDRWSKRFFICYFTALMACSLVSLADLIMNQYLGIALQRIFGFVEVLLLSVPIPMLTGYLVHCCKNDVKKKAVLRTTAVFWIVFFLLLGSTLFTEHIYIVQTAGQFQRGEWFALLLIPLDAITLLNMVCLIRWRRLLSRKYFLAFLIAILPMTATLLVHTFTDVAALLDISTVLSAVSMFGLIISEQIAQNLRQQQEIARQQASVNVLQMRPHFIYNTMMSIYYLIAQDTEKAQQITLDFSAYLRKNFTALAKEDAVPFDEELEHTRAYLSIEQTRFEDNLFVEFDTPHTSFRIPPLTLQPIVENAVKHGLDPELSPLHVTIKTRHTENGSVITVEDTGPGFGENDNDEPHVALANIQKRLQMMCDGKLEIAQRKEGGTAVTVWIPEHTA